MVDFEVAAFTGKKAPCNSGACAPDLKNTTVRQTIRMDKFYQDNPKNWMLR
jgi:hypothetical protein